MIDTLFLDIGGVLLTNGWDRRARARAAKTFHIDFEEMDERHHLSFDTYEEGRLSLDGYLEQVVFFKNRSFSKQAFIDFMYSVSQPYPDMLKLIHTLKESHRLKTVAVSNEGRELTLYRIQQFHLKETIDCFVSSCFVHTRKPDPDIYRIALDVSQSLPERVVYLDDRLLFVELARGLRIHGIHHTGYESTCQALADLELRSA